MFLRSLGAGIVALAVVMLVASLYGLHGVSATGRVVAATLPPWRHDVDMQGWKAHFQAYWVTWLVAAVTAGIGGVLLLRARAAGLTLFIIASAIVLFYPAGVWVFFGESYPFETLSYTNAAVALSFLCLAVVARVALLRRPVR
nr:hypothetical protein [Luteibacter rhizovicinus]